DAFAPATRAGNRPRVRREWANAQARFRERNQVQTTRTDAAQASPGRRRFSPPLRPASPPRPELSWPTQLFLGLAVTAALVAVAYFFVDRPVAFFVRDAGLKSVRFLKWLTRPPEAFVILSPLVLLAGLLRRLFGPWTRPEKVAVVAAVST